MYFEMRMEKENKPYRQQNICLWRNKGSRIAIRHVQWQVLEDGTCCVKHAGQGPCGNYPNEMKYPPCSYGWENLQAEVRAKAKTQSPKMYEWLSKERSIKK